MNLTKEECLKEIHNLERYIGREFECSQVMRECENSLDVLEQLINKYFEDLGWEDITMINQNLGTKYLEKYNELYKEHLKLKEEKERLERMLETFK